MAGIQDLINQYILGPAFAPADPNFVGPPMPPNVIRQGLGLTTPNSAGPAVQGAFLQPTLESIIRGGQSVAEIPGNIARGAERVGNAAQAGMDAVVPRTSPVGKFLNQPPAHVAIADAVGNPFKGLLTPESEGRPSPTSSPGRLTWTPSAGPVASSNTTTGGAPSGVGTNVDTTDAYLDRMTRAESGDRNVPNAAGASSASGWMQFTNGTWVNTVRKHIPEMKDMSDKEILQMRNDKQFHREIGKLFTKDNEQILQQNGLPVNDMTRYGMHFFGEGDGPKVLSAPDSQPIEQVADPRSIAANPHLKGMTVGDAKNWLARTMAKQAGERVSPDLPNLQAPQIPGVPQLQAPQGVDLSGMMDIVRSMKPQDRAELGTGERIANILGGMAGGAQGAQQGGISDLLLGIGAGAMKGGQVTAQTNERRQEANRDDKQRYLGTLATATGRVAEQTAENANKIISTNNTNAMNAFERTKAQAEADTQVKNKLEEFKYKINFEEYEQGKPQVTVSNGVAYTITRDRNGVPDIKATQLKDADSNIFKLMDNIEKAGLAKTSPEYQRLRYGSLMQMTGSNPAMGELLARRELVKDMMEAGSVEQMLKSPTAAKALRTKAEQGISVQLKNLKPEEAEKVINQKMVDLFLEESQDRQLPDEWIKEMARNGHIGAQMFIARAQGVQ